MVKFGEQLLSLRHEPWASYYLDYNGLKDILNQSAAQATAAVSVDSSGNLQRSISMRSSLVGRFALDEPPASTLFLMQLNAQVEKIVLFFLQEQGRIAYQFVEYRQEQQKQQQLQQLSTSSMRAESQQYQLQQQVLHDKYQQAGQQLLHLIQFVDVNVTAVRKILKKHDKLMRWAASSLYLGGNRRSSYMMRPLLRDETLACLCVTLETALAELEQERQTAVGGSQTLVKAPLALSRGRSLADSVMSRVSGRSDSVGHRRVLSHVSQGLSSRGPSTEPLLNQIYQARRRLQQNSEYMEMLATTVLYGSRSFQMDDNDDMTQVSNLGEEDGPSWLSNQLNLMSTFLYMVNYFIVAPTSGSYAQKLGSNENLASLIIGMTPIAAIVSTLLYSWWTSHSYKAALIFASSCSLVGNLFYAAGLPCNSLTLVLIGRLFNGFGSARSINRRYIADSFARSERTAASAAFVTAGALGMAAGPALASLLEVATNSSVSPYWQVENAPGWFMFAMWSLYLVLLVFFFEDPPRREDYTTPKIEITESEQHPLIKNRDSPDTQASSRSSEKPLWKNTAVLLTFLIYFVLKLVLECVLSSSSILTRFYFGWSAGRSGIFLAVLGLLMLPANFVVARLARNYDDRELIVGFLVRLLSYLSTCIHRAFAKALHTRNTEHFLSTFACSRPSC
jgi:predicted MFS family arabinose efflux permease